MNHGSYRKGFVRGSHAMGEPSRNGGFFHTLLTLLLAIALVVTLVLTLPSTSFKNDYRSITIERIQKECDTVITYSRYLSRTASSNSNAQLAVIRSSVYTVQVLNETYASLQGGGAYLLDTALTDDIFTTLDSYYSRLTTGTNTSDQQTVLSTQLEALQTAAAELK